MVLIERRSKTGENEWMSAVIVLATCLLVPLLEGDVKWLVLAVVTLPIVGFEAFRKKVREPLIGIWDETVYFYRKGKLTASFSLADISDMKVESRGVNGEVLVLRLINEEEFRFDITKCRRILRKAIVKCLHKHLSLKPGLKLQQVA